MFGLMKWKKCLVCNERYIYIYLNYWYLNGRLIKQNLKICEINFLLLFFIFLVFSFKWTQNDNF